MAELTIELRRNPQTGKQDIVIHLESDADSLPHEHEQRHREFVEKIIGKNQVGRVIVERETEKVDSPAANSKEEEAAPQPTAQGHNG